MNPFIRTHSLPAAHSQCDEQQDADHLRLPREISLKAVGSESTMDCELQVRQRTQL
jgi:hypothetical protein